MRPPETAHAALEWQAQMTRTEKASDVTVWRHRFSQRQRRQLAAAAANIRTSGSKVVKRKRLNNTCRRQPYRATFGAVIFFSGDGDDDDDNGKGLIISFRMLVAY